MAQKKHRYIIFSAVLFFIIFILGSLAFFFSMRGIRHANAGRELAQVLEREKLRLKSEVNGEIALVLKMADSPLVRRYFLNPDDTNLEDIAFAEFAGYRQILLPKSIFWVNDIDKKFYLNNTYVYTVDSSASVNYWYNRTLNGQEAFNFNINHNPDLDTTNFWINAAVFDLNHRPIGILGTGVDVTDFINTVYHNYSGDAEIYFFNKGGEITGAMNRYLVANKINFESNLGTTGAIIFSMLGELEGEKIQYFDIPGGVAAIGAIPDFDWYICAILQIGLKETLKTSMTVLFAAMLTVVAGIIIIFNLIQSNFELNRERNIYRDMSIADALTGIYNRRFLEERLEQIIKSLSRSGGKLSLLMLDVDYFKRYNDTYGHNMGDNCLKTLANTLTHSISRADDFVARYGGEEFVIVLPSVDENGAYTVAQKVLHNVRERNIPHEKNDAADIVTVSIGGVTGIVSHSHTWYDYLIKADEALYVSKQNGRNRYTAAQDIIS